MTGDGPTAATMTTTDTKPLTDLVMALVFFVVVVPFVKAAAVTSV